MERGPLALFGAIIAVGLGPAMWLGAQFGNVAVTPDRPPAVTVQQDSRGGVGAAAPDDPADTLNPDPKSNVEPLGAVKPKPHKSSANPSTSASPTPSESSASPTPGDDDGSTPPTDPTQPSGDDPSDDGGGDSGGNGGDNGSGDGDQGVPPAPPSVESTAESAPSV